MMYPLDPAGPAEQVINCRCTCVSVLEGFEEDGLIPPEGWNNGDGNGIINNGATSGALDPNSERAIKHTKNYYESIRKMKTDYIRIANNTGMNENEIKEIKEYLFIDKHNLTEGYKRFDESFDITQSWQRLIDGRNIKEHDIILLKHEMLELKNVKNGLTQNEAHIIASKEYNYSEAVERFR